MGLGDRVRKVNSAGTITTVAGNGTAGYNGDSMPATSAELDLPSYIALDASGNLYIADYGNYRLREVNTAGTITTVAGTGTAGYNGDNIAAANAELTPAGVSLDGNGNIYVGDYLNSRVRELQVGNSFSFGNVNVVSSSTAPVILSINSPVTLTSVATSGDYSVTSDSCALNTGLEEGTLCTLQVKFTPTMSGPRSFPLVVTDSNGNKYSFGLEGVAVASTFAFTPGIVTTVAGNGYGAGSDGETGGYGGDGGPAISAEFNSINDVKVDSAGNLYLADTDNQRIRKVNVSGVVNTIAGNGTAGYSGDNGPSTSAELSFPLATTLDAAGNLYIGDTGNNVVRKVGVNGTITTVAGNGTAGYTGDGSAATSAELNGNEGLTLDMAGNLYIADTLNNRVRKIDRNGIITTVAGTGVAGYNGDNIAASSAELNNPVDLRFDESGDLYIADVNNFRIRRVDTTGVIETFAGTGTQGYTGDGGPAASADLGSPFSLSFDPAGDLYFADGDNNVVRKVSLSGTITTVAGNGYGAGSEGETGGYTGNNGPATSAEFDLPAAASVDGRGNIYIADTYNNVVRKVNVSASAVTFPVTPVGQTSADQIIKVSNVGTAGLNFTSIGASANFPVEDSDGSCAIGAAVGVGQTCEILLAFAPTAPGNPVTGTLTVADNAANSPQTAALSGVAGTAPGITSALATTFGEGVENSFTVTTTGSPTPSITESGMLPNGVTFINNGNGTGSLSGIPSTTGTFPISFTASNGITPNATQNFTLSSSGEVATDTLTVMLLGGGSGTVSDDTGALDCTEVNGEETDGSHCVVNYSVGSMVILTATPTEGSGSSFGGWGGACATAGMSPTCAVTMSNSENVTANFVSAPQSQNLTFNPGTDVVQTAGFGCPGNPDPITPENPCLPSQGPNADAFEVQLAQVFEPFTMTVTRTEFPPTGACPAGGSVSDPTNFACRFVTFFDYGTDSSGNTIVPICDGYSKSNCVHYDIYYCVPQASGPCVPTPGQEPPPADYVNAVSLRISWNNNSFVPPSPTYAGSVQRLYDDPDDPVTPTSPYGTICDQPMMANTSSGTVDEPYSCQFEFDVTTFFDPSGPVDAGIGGTIRQFNDLVVAFPPTTPGMNPVVTPTLPTAPTIAGTCVAGCSISLSNVTFVAGMGGTFALTTKGFPAPTLTLASGTLPSGLSFSTTTGLISGTPASGSEGSYPIAITATNSVSTVTVDFTIVVGSPVPPLEILPVRVNFGNVYLDTGAVKEVTLKNTTGASITISSVKVNSVGPEAAISISGSGDFVALNLCPTTLNAGKSCVVVLTFVAAGSNYSPKANLTITDSAPGSPQVIPLSATIINPIPKLSPLSLNFGSQAEGTSSGLRAVTLTNVGTTQLALSGLGVSGNFALGSGTDACTSTTKLASEAHCEIYVKFSPGTKGPKLGDLKVTDNALVGTQAVLLTGNGT